MPSKTLKPETSKSLQDSGENFESNTSKNGQEDLNELRRLLVRAEGVGAVLPDALEKSQKQDGNKLAQATMPVVEESLRVSAQHNPQILAEVLFPVMGPAIRRAIAEALSSMVQSLNQTLEYSVSPKGLRWRVEAWQTGKSFAEVVILKTLLYRVEQVFLIHRKTGIMLRHVTANPALMEDGDMVSAMLTAIEDFVHDSFKTSSNATLDSLQIDELSVWVEHSPDVVLAAVIRGNAPLTLREILKEVIEKIQLAEETELDNFKGDTKVFERVDLTLRECLQSQIGETKKEVSSPYKPLYAIGAVLGLFVLIVGFFYVRDYLRWSNYLSRLESTPGIVVTEAERGWFTHSVKGLRDNLAVNPDAVLAESGYDASDVETNWKAFQDLSPQFVLMRAKKILNPPETVSLTFEEGVLKASGKASAKWLAEAEKVSVAIAGVNEFRADSNFLKTEN